jgi:hypothetical protein
MRVAEQCRAIGERCRVDTGAEIGAAELCLLGHVDSKV